MGPVLREADTSLWQASTIAAIQRTNFNANRRRQEWTFWWPWTFTAPSNGGTP